MGLRSNETTVKNRERGENGRKLKSICHPAVVAKNINSQGVGAKRTVSLHCLLFIRSTQLYS